jgi:hypothetical protein
VKIRRSKIVVVMMAAIVTVIVIVTMRLPAEDQRRGGVYHEAHDCDNQSLIKGNGRAPCPRTLAAIPRTRLSGVSSALLISS